MLKRLLAKASPILGSRSDWLGLCLLCRQPCDDQPLLCSWCQQSLHQPCRKCRLCAAPLPEHHAGNELLCGRCQRRPPPWERLQVIGDYQLPYSLLIPRLKYSGQILLAPLLAQLLADHLEGDDPPEAIIPVPLHWWRQWWRGFNQAEEIGTALGELTGIPCDTRLLRRFRRRWPALSRVCCGVALLDDVVTTGATAGQLTRLLHESGIARVEVWAICRTLRHIK